MRKIFTLSFVLVLFLGSNAQTSETHNFITYDTTYSSAFGSWQIRISRPANMFIAGSADTASRPAIITMPGIGEAGNNNPNNLIVYGPHYWMLNGWDGSVALGNGTHYPIIITVAYISNTWPAAEQVADVLSFLLSHYHIKRNSVHLGGLSLGSFMWTSLIAYEQSPGAETGMSMVTSITALEGFSLYEDAPYSTWSRGDVAYQVWAQKYHGHFFGLEGTDDYRNVAQGEKDMNSVVRGSAHFSYENLGGGAHCCWNSMYDPSQHNWQSFPAYGPYVATGVDTNSRGSYQNGSSIFQWMLRQGDTSVVGSGTPAPPPAPVANAGTSQSITLPTSSVTLAGSGSEQGGTIKGYAWTLFSGPTQYTINNAGIANPVVSNLVAGTYVFKLTVTDANGALASDTISVVVNSAPKAPVVVVYYPLLGTTQAENYAAMSGIITEGTTDAGGGGDVGAIDQGDWMSYNVTAASAGTYTISFRVASPHTGASFQVQNAAGAVLATVVVPNTGGFQTWATVNANINVPAGQQTLKLVSVGSPNWNLNWFACPAPSNLDGAGQQAIPGVIQAESYSSMSGIGTQATSDAGGGLNVGWINSGDWMAYTVNVAAAGVYTVNFRVATGDNGVGLHLDNGSGTTYAQVSVPNTGGFQNWTTVSAAVTLKAGVQTLRVVSTGALFNINWLSFSTSSSTVFTVPGVVQAESYSSMSGVATQATSDAGGGLNVGWINQGDWMEYTVDVATAGAYTVKYRVATADNGASFLLDDGVGNSYAQVAVPNTGGFQSWGTGSAVVNLKAGVQTIRLVSTSFYQWNVNWLEFDAITTGASNNSTALAGTATSSFDADSSVGGKADVLLLYPNPTRDAFYLELNDNHTGKFQVQVINTSGSLVKTYSFDKGLSAMQVQVSLAGLPAGVYVIHIGGDSWQEVRKVIKL